MKRPKTGFQSGRGGNTSPKKPSKKSQVPHDLEDELKKHQGALMESIDNVFDEDDEEHEDGDDVKAVFAKQFERLRMDIDSSNKTFNASSTTRAMTRAMLAMVIDVIPLAEKAYRQTQKENQAYALNALVNQARELSTDLKMMQDVEGQAEFIRNQLIDPLMMSLTQQIMASMLSLKNSIDTELGAKAPGRAKTLKRQVDDNLRGLGEFLQGAKDKLSSDVFRYLSGDPTLLGQRKPSGKPRRGQ